jgi:tripartite-type tricarboxylate transporter receptor subunit TctC
MKKLYITVALLLVVALLAGGLSCAKPAPAPAPKPAPAPAPKPAPAPAPKPAPKPQTAADFYKENRITMVVPFSAGGGTDQAARILTTWWPDVTDGSVKIKNMPGGGGMLGTNTVYTSKPDGLTLGILSVASTSIGYLFKDPGCKYDIGKLTYMITFAAEPQGFGIGAKLPYESMADLQKAKGLKFGTSGRRHEMGTALLCDLFGLDGAVIPGYKNSPATGLAIAQGELHGMVSSMGSIKDEVNKGFMKPLLTVGPEKAALYPDLPLILDLAKPTPAQQVFVDIYMPTVAGRVVFGPPGIPEDRVKFLRDTFLKITEASGYQKMAKSRWGAVDPSVPGDKTQVSMTNLKKISETDLDKFSKMVESYVRR